ncbi:hypothetical protein V5O48_006520 [Marasmius crinis-equi]|uniref:Uncharacterized protein n=1 Tax=Marasmius crinis-equi TaxID=585013 RepID=A0ABR3FJ92_9AGAR
MSAYSSFQGARHTRIGGNAQFNQAGTVINIGPNNTGTLSIVGPSELRSKWKRQPKELDEGDVILREEISSDIMEINIDQSRRWGTNNPFRDQVESAHSKVKVQRRVYAAEVVQCGDRSFTVYQFKPEDTEDETLDAASILHIWERITEVSSQK